MFGDDIIEPELTLQSLYQQAAERQVGCNCDSGFEHCEINHLIQDLNQGVWGTHVGCVWG